MRMASVRDPPLLERPRSALDGQTPAGILSTGWDSEDGSPQEVMTRGLAAVVIVLRNADRDVRFYWESDAQLAGRWHDDREGPHSI
ncbi:MAG: hypothetical protein H0X59_08460 [Chloroflexi bacterium]|nr:hypothetical protein [Chloroflexota bacterium]